jgi:hypothetical protein
MYEEWRIVFDCMKLRVPPGGGALFCFAKKYVFRKSVFENEPVKPLKNTPIKNAQSELFTEARWDDVQTKNEEDWEGK